VSYDIVVAFVGIVEVVEDVEVVGSVRDVD
jgi:hypothetical protein